MNTEQDKPRNKLCQLKKTKGKCCTALKSTEAVTGASSVQHTDNTGRMDFWQYLKFNLLHQIITF